MDKKGMIKGQYINNDFSNKLITTLYCIAYTLKTQQCYTHTSFSSLPLSLMNARTHFAPFLEYVCTDLVNLHCYSVYKRHPFYKPSIIVFLRKNLEILNARQNTCMTKTLFH